MITLSEVSAGYGDGPLFRNFSHTVNSGERVGIVGPNGAGKSTLLRVMAGEHRPDSGGVTFEATVGHLVQVPDAEERVTSYMDRMSGGLLSALSTLDELYPKMGDPEIDEQVSKLQSKLDDSNGWGIESKVDEVLSRLGVEEGSAAKQFGELSGGQQSRVLLAGQLILEPEVLLLDEPTNNLDQEGLTWLEQYLANYKGGIAVVSHDRAFLDATANRIVELDGEGGEPIVYPGGYTDYRDQKAADFAKLILDYEAQTKREEALEGAITKRAALANKFQGASTNDFYRRKGAGVAATAKAMEHRLERMRRSTDWIHERPEERQSMPLQLRGTADKGRLALAATGLQLGYNNENPILRNVSFTVHGQDRIAITGNNGSGKSTLLNALAGREDLIQKGTVDVRADFDYLTQTENYNQAKQSKDTTLEWFRKLVGPMYEDEAFSLLVWFGMDRRQVTQPVSKLSPGEISKISLLAMTFSGKDLLFLDEPTNHLDFDALDVVEDVLGEYKGTLLVASHDRKFLGALALTNTLQIADGSIKMMDIAA